MNVNGEDVGVHSQCKLDEWDMLRLLRIGSIVQVQKLVCRVLGFDIQQSRHEMPVKLLSLEYGTEHTVKLPDISGFMLSVAPMKTESDVVSRSIRQEPVRFSEAQVRAFRRYDAEGIPTEPARRTDEQIERAERILRREEELIRIEENCKAAGWPHTRELFMQAIKDWIADNDAKKGGAKTWEEPTHVILPPVMRELISHWNSDGGVPQAGDVVCNLTVLDGGAFSLERRA